MKSSDRIRRIWKTVSILFLYAISIVLVFLMYPREGKFQYEYVKNTPWKHSDLIAPFDFPVYKDDAQLAEEIEIITQNSLPHFSLDTTVLNSMLSELVSNFEEAGEDVIQIPMIRTFRERVYDTLPGLLSAVYEKGIIELHPVIQQEDDPVEEVIVLKRQVAEEVALVDLYTEKMAYEHIMTFLTNYTNKSDEQILSAFTIANYIKPNLLFDASMTNNVLNAKLEKMAKTQGMVQSGQIIISRGELVSPEKFRLVESLRMEYETNQNVYRNYTLLSFGQFILISVLFLSLLWYVSNFRKELMSSSAQTLFILSLIVLMVFLTKMAVNNDTISYYVIPFAIVPIFLKTFFNVRFGLFVHFLILLLAGFWVPNSYQFILMNFLAGVVAVFSMRSYYRRSILFYIALFVGLTYSLVYLILALMQEGTIEGVDWTQMFWFGGNGLLILTVYPLIYIFEKLFGFLSDASLFELSDTNQPILRQLAEKAPGTFQHSLQVASLSEEAIRHVGGNPLLARTGALYHDIGKMKNPYFFIENQREGENPHNQIDFKSSAKIIIDHVIDGVELAKKNNIPAQIIDFIRTHHGTSTVQYFYKSYLNTNPDEAVNIKDFRYPGPKPYMKEMAVLMIADSVEAASRAMKNITDESINDLVDSIVNHQMEEQQYDEADITFADITAIKKIFKKKLNDIYHARIAYPE